MCYRPTPPTIKTGIALTNKRLIPHNKRLRHFCPGLSLQWPVILLHLLMSSYNHSSLAVDFRGIRGWDFSEILLGKLHYSSVGGRHPPEILTTLANHFIGPLFYPRIPKNRRLKIFRPPPSGCVKKFSPPPLCR